MASISENQLTAEGLDGMWSPVLQGRYATLGEALGGAAAQFGNRAAYVETGARISYQDWIHRADCVATELVSRGVRPGDVVAMMLESSIDFAVVYAAIERVGGIATGINLRLGRVEIEGILARCAPRVVVCENGIPVPDTNGAGLIRRSDLAGCKTPLPFETRSARDDIAVIVWTSGTTGMPKGASYDHAALEASAASARYIAAPFDTRLMPTPFCHAGYITKLWEQIAFATTIVITPTPWRAAETLALMESEKVTVGAAVPTQWSKIVELPNIERADLSSLRLCLTASAPASPELVDAVCNRLGAPMLVRYAMSEAPSVSSTAPSDAPEILNLTVGKPLPGVQVRLVDDAGAQVANGEIGRVTLKSDGMMKGYWGAPEETAKVFDERGWLLTGDAGRFDAEGNLILVGRTTDMYIRGGYNIYPIEVENVLREHPGVADVSVIGTPAPVIGEIGVAFIVADSERPGTTADELRNWVRANLADYKVPDEIRFVPALPLTAMMKVDKAALRAGLTGGHVETAS